MKSKKLVISKQTQKVEFMKVQTDNYYKTDYWFEEYFKAEIEELQKLYKDYEIVVIDEDITTVKGAQFSIQF